MICLIFNKDRFMYVLTCFNIFVFRPIEGDKISGLSDDLNGLHLEDTKTSSENH